MFLGPNFCTGLFRGRGLKGLVLWPGFAGTGVPVMFISGFSTNLIWVGGEIAEGFVYIMALFS